MFKVDENLIQKDVEPVVLYKIENAFQEDLDSYPKEIASQYLYDDETRTYYIPEYVWLEWRKHGPNKDIDVAIGGSDIAALYDGSALEDVIHLYDGQHGSPYKTAIELFYEKSGIKLPLKETFNPEIFWVGHNEEPSIRRLFKKKFQKEHPEDIIEVINDTHMYQCGIKNADGSLKYPFVLCDLDGTIVINGIKGVLECKTCRLGSEDYKLWKKGIVPLKYFLQVHWYLLATNRAFAYIICKWGLGMEDCRYIRIDRDFEIEQEILNTATAFVEAVKTGVVPNTNGQNVERLYTFYRKKAGNYDPDIPPVELSEDMMSDVMDIHMKNFAIAQKTKEIGELTKERNAILVKKIFPVVGNSNEAYIKSGDSVLTLKLKNKSTSSVKLNIEHLKVAHPDVYESYLVKNEIFNTATFQKEQKALYDECLVEDDTLTEGKMNYCKVSFK